MTTQSMHIPGLDGLRAFACLAVFGVHFHQITGLSGTWGPLSLHRLLENGNTGVALFYALSGFLLSLPFWRGQLRNAGHFWLVGYIRRRLFRIVPAFFVCLTVLVIWQRNWQSSHERIDTLSHYLFVHNFSEQFFYSISPPFWTLAVQAQFYVLLPFLLWLLTYIDRGGRSIWFAAILTLSLASYGIHYFLMLKGDRLGTLLGVANLVSSRPTVFSHSVVAHLPHLLWGVLIACVFVRLSECEASRWRSSVCDVVFAVTVFLILAILATPLDDIFQVPFGRYNFPYIPALIAVIIACTPFTLVARRILELFPIRRLGEISFGFYVYHLPCMRLIEREMPRVGLTASDNWITFGIASLLLSIFVAGVSYYAFERPIVRRAKRSPRTTVA